MRRTLSVLGASLLLCLATAGIASANDLGTGPLFDQSQTSSQSQNGTNSVSQDASSKAISAPLGQINLNAPISLLSSGNNGPVDQSNSSSATSSASNDSAAIQVVDQSQGSDQTQDGKQTAGGGSPAFEQGQDSTQSQNGTNSIDQNASSTAISKPGPQVNVNVPIRILSDGNNGPVEQSNSSSADSSASNTSYAKQGVEQGQSSTQEQDGTQKAGCGCEGSGSSPYFGQDQSSDQSQNGSNSVSQNAESKAISKPGPQINVNAPIRILSPGYDGKVDQSNSSSATSSASNESKAIQLIGQGQESSQSQDGTQTVGCCDRGKPGHYGSKGKEPGCGCGEHSSSPTFEQGQTSDQSQDASNSVSQYADSKAISKPGKQANLNTPVSILGGHSCGCEPKRYEGGGHPCGCGHGDDKGGDVTQSNGSSATSSASNESKAIQLIGQGQESSQSQDGTQTVGCCDRGKPGHYGSKGKEPGCGCENGSGPAFTQEQTSDQSQNGSNSVSQNAESKAVSKPGKQLNLNAPIGVLDGHSCGCENGPSWGKGKQKGSGRSCGCGPGKGSGKDKGGNVNQSNASTADSSASNKNWSAQLVGQGQANGQLQKGLQRL